MSTLCLSATLRDGPRTWRLEAPLVRIGRSSSCEVHLADASVSRRHAEVFRDGMRHLVRDLGSRNGTRVNGTEVREPAPIGPGDLLEVGDVTVRISTAEEAGRPALAPEATRMDTSVQLRADQLVEARAPGRHGPPSLVDCLFAAGRLLVTPRPLPETCEEILEVIARAVPATRHVLLLRDGPAGELRQVAARHLGGRPDRPLALSRSIVDRVLRECTSVITADALRDSRFRAQQSVVLQAVHSAMAVPLFDDREVLGLLYVDSQDLSLAFDAAQLEVLTLLANMAAVKITNARLLHDEQARQRLAHELAVAARIQRAMLAPAPCVPGWRIDAHLETCHEVGGDLYDCHVGRDGRLVLQVGDVTGKGIGAALLMSSFLAASRVLYESCAEPAALARRLDGVVRDHGDPARFVTGVLGCLDPATGALRYVNAGHPAPFLLRDDTVERLDSCTAPFGVLPEWSGETRATAIPPGGLLALFSDGIPEAHSETRPGAGMFEEERLRDALLEAAAAPDLADVRRGVLARLDEFLGDAPRSDDVTLLLVRREGG